MNLLESQLDYPFGDALPERGSAIEVAPGIVWIRMGLPFQLDHINVWALRDETDGRAGWTLVDTGVDNPATRADWDQVLAGPLGGEPVLRVVVTHMHPDHIGSAHWLCERFGARLWISATDFHIARIASGATSGFSAPVSNAFMVEHGLAADAKAAEIGKRSNYYRSLVPQVPSEYRRLLDGGSVEIGRGAARHAWRCIAGYGHAPEHMSLHDDEAGVLVSGDMVLPRISTNVSVIDIEPEADPLRLYLDSLERMRAVPADTLVLPSHGRPFRGLHTRIDQLQAHHEDRFAEVMDAIREKGPQSAYELVPVIFRRPLDAHQMSFAMGESIAHLHALWHAGRLSRQPGDDKVMRFAAVAAG